MMPDIKYLTNLIRLNKKKILALITISLFIFSFNQNFAKNSFRNDSFIFVGGFGRSGTTLMRAILDAHPNIRCGPETKIIPSILQWYKYITEQKALMKQIKDAGMELKVMDEAMKKFLKEIIFQNGKKVEHLCDKDPNIAKHILYLKQIFPNSKFILMIRDPRAVVLSYSKIYRKTNDTKYLEKTAKSWNTFMETAVEECNIAGESFCMMVYYEKLVTDPEKEIKNVINFIGEKWHNSLLNHEKYIGDEIVVSKSEWSTNQIKKGIHTDSINLWTKKLPNKFIKDFRNFVPILFRSKYLNYSIEI